jgi:hypothetical protein
MGHTITSFNKRFNVPLLASIFLTLFLIPTLTQGQFSVSVTPTAVKCFGGNNGAATASATGGVSPYTYAWGGGQTGATISNQTAGTVNVTVTDNTGATKTGSGVIAQPAQLGATAFGQSQICGVVPDGVASAVPFGGTAPYTYKWSNNSTSAQITSLAQGTYTVTVTDANGCTTSASTQINFWNEGIWVMVANTPVKCNGQNNGTTHVSVMSGTAPYTYAWSNGASGADLTNLAPGTYQVTVTDGNGCSNSTSTNITQPAALVGTTSSSNAVCGNTGTAALNISGGTAPYSVLWSNNSTNTNLSNLAPGTYTATIKDANNCSATASVTVSGSNAALTVSTSLVSNATCSAGGSATASVAGGGTFTYAWDNSQTSATATNLSAGNHTVLVTNTATGCTGTGSITIGQSGGPTVAATITLQATCITGAGAAASATGGTAPYGYKWDNNQTTAAATNLSVGNHTVTVTDAGGCTGVGTVNVAQPQGPTLVVSLGSNATCSTGGSASVTASAGVGSYVYLWDNNQTTATATNLSIGNHSVTVTDAAGCSKVGTVTISGPASGGPTAIATAVTQATCLTGGSASVAATGGATPYTYKWDNNQTTAIATNLTGGVHTVTVTDANGCANVATVTVAQQQAPTVTTTAVSNATCATGGSATVTASPAGTYTYKWDNNQTTATATNLTIGAHTVTVTDAGGCTKVGNVTITGSTPPVATISSSGNAKCDQAGSATVAATGGTAPYTYKWDNNETTASAINLTPTAHTVTVTDAGGCTAIASVTIGLTNNGIKIGDYMWYDTDQDGFQDPQDTQGVPNITVMLMKPGTDGVFGTGDDVVFKTTTTNAAGKYEFDCVTPGNYVIMFGTIPAGFEFTRKDNVNNDCLDSDVGANGKTSQFTIVAGQPNNLCFDAGIHPLCDNVFNAGQVCCDQTICAGTAPATLTTLVAAFGGTGAVQYQWLEFLDIGPAGPLWVPIVGATSETYSPGILTQTSFFMRCARSTGCVEFLESNIVTIKVNALGTPGCGQFLQNFNVSLLSAHAVNIAWETNPEPTQYMYFVQHSADNVTWETIGEVMGHSDASANNTYKFVHGQPSVGQNFYRIKRLDANNLQVLSDAVELKMADFPIEESMAISPNPVTNTVVVKNLMTYDNDVNIKISSTNGVVLYDLNIPTGSLKNFDLNMDHLPTGIYLAQIRFSKSVVKTVKLVKL